MTKEEIIEQLEITRRRKVDEITILNAKHDAILQYIAELNALIDTAKEE